MDLAAPQLELMVWTAMVREEPRVAEAVQHVPEQGGKPGAVQTVTTEPSVENNGRNESTFHPSNRDNKPKLQNKQRRPQNVNSDSVFSNDNLAKLR
jgi:hypothetical protein